ncbi:DegQ family serine endoprotease [soil metagenome]
MSNNRFRKTVVATAIVALSASGGAWLALHPQAQPIAPVHAANEAGQVVVPQAPRSAVLPSFADLVQAYGPAVVNITVSQRIQPTAMDESNPLAPFFNQQPQRQGRVVRGLGSGFILSNDGYIMTNAHVVDGATSVNVKLTDRREFKARVVGVDKRTDVAIVKIEATDLPTVKIGSPDDSRIGDWVVAIGSPFGFENSVTSGILSAKSRSLPSDNYVGFLQTDVPINPGNSGGPLFNLQGEVIGINSQIFSESGGYMGIAFAIPIDVAMKVAGDLRSSGHVTRGQLGAMVSEVNAPLAKSLKLPEVAGAVVVAVEPGSAAEKAGVEPGDVIRKFNNTPVLSSIDLPRLVADIKPGSKATLDIWRNGASKTIDATVQQLKEEKLASASDNQSKLGLAVRPLSPDEQREVHAKGLVVEQVTGAAEQAGVQSGDIVLMAGGKPVTSVADLRKQVETADGVLPLIVQRDSVKTFIPVPLG